MGVVGGRLVAAGVALPLTFTTGMSPRFSAWPPIRCLAAAFSAAAVPDDRPNRGWIEVAATRDSAVFTAAFDVLGARAVLPRSSVLPVTYGPRRTAITLSRTLPVR